MIELQHAVTAPWASLFEARRLPARDHRGHVKHPDLPVVAAEAELPAAIGALGCSVREVDLYDDPNNGYAYELYIAGDDNLSVWSPTPPRGWGWRLAGIWEREGGPVAVFVRPSLWIRLRNWWVVARAPRKMPHPGLRRME